MSLFLCCLCEAPMIKGIVTVSSRKLCQNTGKFPRRIFSGIQPTGIPHLGNYLGAICQWVELQNQHDDVIYSIVDLHSITVPQDSKTLRENILDMTACLLASGIDPKKSILFQQSSVPEHAELSWVLGCLTTMPRLEHLPQWKEKSHRMKETPFGLFSYPVLQSADIILYKATDVPVGDDQVKHIELTRHLVNRFNKQYGLFFPKPKPIVGDFRRIKSLRDPTSKMSKSEVDVKSRIELTDTPEEIREKCRKAITDMTSAVTYDPETRPGVSNLVEICSAVTGKSVEEVVREANQTDTLGFKYVVAEAVIERLKPIREEITRLKADRGYLVEVLRLGHERARNIASQNFTDIKRLIGMID